MEDIIQKVFNVYIDEAGDEGFKFDKRLGHGSSSFFVLSAIIVQKENDLELARLVNELKVMLKFQKKDMLSPLHFCKMSHDKRKACINKLVDFKNFTIISVIFNKESLKEPLKMKSILYNYACKILLKQVTMFLKQHNAKANFTFEHRRNTHYDELQVHIKKIIDTNKYVLSIKPLPKAQSKCLQLADIVASSTYQAFEPNQYDGDVESSYLEKLQNNLFVCNEKCIGYGLKLFPYSANILEQEKYTWLNIMLNNMQKGLKNVNK